jgi:hypothetical protein
MLASILIPTIRESLIISATQSYVSDIQKNCHDLLTQPTTWSPKFLSTTMNKAENESINGLIGLLNTNKHDLFQQLIHINAFAHQYPDIFDLIKSRMSLVRSESPEVNVENQALVLRVPALHA